MGHSNRSGLSSIKSTQEVKKETVSERNEKKRLTKPTTTRRESSDLFKSFAKTQPPKLKRENTDSSAASLALSRSVSKWG